MVLGGFGWFRVLVTTAYLQCKLYTVDEIRDLL